MGCVSPSTLFPTREDMWFSTTLLQAGNEESPAPISPLRGGRRSSPLSAPWFPGTVERHLSRLSKTSILQARDRERSGRVCSHPWICFISPDGTQEKMLGKNHIYTNCSALLLFPGRLQTPLQGELQGEWCWTSLCHPRRVQETGLRCFRSLGCSILILMASCLFSELRPAVLPPSPTLPTSTELVTPHTKLTGSLCYI